MNATDWVTKELGDVLVLKYGWSLPAHTRVAGPVPVYGSNGIVGHHDSAFVESAGLIVGRKGSAGNVHYSQVPFCPIDTTFFIGPKDTTLDLDFLYYLLLHVDLKRILGDVGVPGLNREVAYREVVTFPQDSNEQKAIALVLTAARRAMADKERVHLLTSELRQSLLRQLFTKGIHGGRQKQTDVGLVPDRWRTSTLKEAGEVVYGIQAAVANNLQPVGTKILTNKNITLNGTIDLESINYFKLKTARHHATVLKKGDILFNWRSGSKEHVGKTAYFDLEGDYTHSSFILRIRPHDDVTGRFLFYYLNYLRETGFFVKSQERDWVD
jgi:type I restriction enzyme, S subunit